MNEIRRPPSPLQIQDRSRPGSPTTQTAYGQSQRHATTSPVTSFHGGQMPRLETGSSTQRPRYAPPQSPTRPTPALFQAQSPTTSAPAARRNSDFLSQMTARPDRTSSNRYGQAMPNRYGQAMQPHGNLTMPDPSRYAPPASPRPSPSPSPSSSSPLSNPFAGSMPPTATRPSSTASHAAPADRFQPPRFGELPPGHPQRQQEAAEWKNGPPRINSMPTTQARPDFGNWVSQNQGFLQSNPPDHALDQRVTAAFGKPHHVTNDGSSYHLMSGERPAEQNRYQASGRNM